MKKLTYEEVKEYIELQGYALLSTEYIRSIDKLQMKCPLGHIFKMSFHSFKDGNHRCPYCYDEHRNETTRFTYEEVKGYIENKGYKLLSTEYINSLSKLQIKCPKGHIFQTTFNDFKNQGSRCSICAIKSRADKQKLSYEEVKQYIESFNYKLISTEYQNYMTKLDIRCPLNHKFKMTYGCFKQGCRCPICSKQNGSEKRKHSYEYIKNYIESFSYKLLSNEYIKSKSKLLLRCPEGHEWNVSFDNFQSGRRCPICNISKGEQRIMDYLNKNNIKYIYNIEYFDGLLSPLGNPLRPDFIIEDKKIWIEYDGEFHYKDFYKDGNYEKLQINDKLKNEYAKKNGWRLIRIPYWNFDNIEEILNKELR